MKKETIRQKTHNSVDKVMDKAENIRDNSKDAMLHLKEKVMGKKVDFDEYIKDHPKKTVLIGAGIGAIFGAWLVAVMVRRKK